MKDKGLHRGEVMDYQLYKRVIDQIVKDKTTLLPQDMASTFSLIFHGGEPTIIGYNQLAKMLEYAKTAFESIRIPYNFGIQTNMTLLDEELVSLLHRYNVGIGASFDGIKKGNEGRSKVINEDKFLDKIKMVKRLNAQIGFLIVANKYNIDTTEESKRYLIDELGSKSVKINYAEDVNSKNPETSTEISGEDYYEKVLVPQLESFITEGDSDESNVELYINKFLTDKFSTKIGPQHYNCGGKVCGGGVNIIELNPDGSLYYCGRYSGEFDDAYVMDIHDKDILSLKQIKRYTDFVEQKHYALLDAGCDTCYADAICDHGCMAFHYSKYGKFGIRTELVCPIHKSLYKWLSSHQVDLVKALEKRYGFPYSFNPEWHVEKIEKSGFYWTLYHQEGIEAKLIRDGRIELTRIKDKEEANELHNNE